MSKGTDSELDMLRRKVQTYEAFLHQLQLYAEVTLNDHGIRSLIKNACAWSYAHRVGNGELSEDEQDKLVARALGKLLTVPDR